MSKQHVGIKEQIQQAESVEAIQLLLDKGSAFKGASPATRKAWVAASAKRTRQLNTSAS